MLFSPFSFFRDAAFSAAYADFSADIFHTPLFCCALLSFDFLLMFSIISLAADTPMLRHFSFRFH